MENGSEVGLGLAPPSSPSTAGLETNHLSLLCLLLITLGITGNSLVILAVWTERRLQSTTNYFLLSLAVVDLLVSAVVMPLGIWQEFHLGRGAGGFRICLFQVYADVLLCSASIVHMSVVALERYWGISRPLRLRGATGCGVVGRIVAVWLVAVAISSPIALLALLQRRNVYSGRGECAIANPHYQITGSILAFFIPLVIMVVAYVKTTRLLSQQALLCQRTDERGLRRTMTRSRRRRHSDSAPSGLGARARTSSPLPSLTPTGSPPASAKASVASAKASLAASSAASQHLLRKHSALPHPAPRENAHIHALLAMHILQTTEGIKLPPMSTEEEVMAELGKLGSRLKERTVRLLRVMGRTKAAEVANEQKATRVLGLVFAVFFVCWFPFFSVNVLTAGCALWGPCPWPPPSPALVSTFAWLGYLSSCANPIIYTVFNAQFRHAFARLLSCRRLCDPGPSRRSTLCKQQQLERRRLPSCTDAALPDLSTSAPQPSHTHSTSVPLPSHSLLPTNDSSI